jgi:hypothetical protein
MLRISYYGNASQQTNLLCPARLQGAHSVGHPGVFGEYRCMSCELGQTCDTERLSGVILTGMIPRANIINEPFVITISCTDKPGVIPALDPELIAIDTTIRDALVALRSPGDPPCVHQRDYPTIIFGHLR